MTTIKIVAEKRAEPARVKESEIAVGGYYKNQLAAFTLRRVQVFGHLDDFYFSSSQDDFTTLIRGSGLAMVYPCNPDGTLIEDESAAVEKVRAICCVAPACLDSDGKLCLIAGRDKDGDVIVWRDGMGPVETDHDPAFLPADALVTPVTITEIYYRGGAK